MPSRTLLTWFIAVPLLLPGCRPTQVISSAIAEPFLAHPQTTGQGLPDHTTPNWQFAFWVENPTPGAGRQLLTVRLFSGPEGLPNLPLRLRLYEAAGPDHQPGKDILTENVIFCKARPGGWYSLDLREYQMTLPASGFFVALESMLTSDTFFCSQVLPAYQPTGPVVSPADPVLSYWAITPRGAWHLLSKATDRPLYERFVQFEITEP